MEFIIAMIVIIISIPVALLTGIYIEKRLFNKGKCIYCNENLQYFDVDSQNNRGYKCPKCQHIVWISYRSVDQSFKR